MFNLILFILAFLAFTFSLRYCSWKAGYKKGDYDGFRRYHRIQICIDCKNHNTSCPNYFGYCKWEH